jgi:hypothetical protein
MTMKKLLALALAGAALLAQPALPSPAEAKQTNCCYTKDGRIDEKKVKSAAIAYLDRSLKARPAFKKRLTQIGRYRYLVEKVTRDESNATATVAVQEDHPDHVVTVWRFEVDPLFETIAFYDVLSDSTVTLDEAVKKQLL